MKLAGQSAVSAFDLFSGSVTLKAQNFVEIGCFSHIIFHFNGNENEWRVISIRIVI
jgi:hypothetical protein